MFKSKKEKAKKALAKQGYANPQDALFKAAENGDTTLIDLAITAGADAHAKNIVSNTALHLAAENGHIAMIDHLVSHYHLDVQAKSDYGNTALHLAAWNGHNDTIDHLVNRYHLDVQAKTNHGNTALLLAARYGHTATVDHLVNRYHLDVQAKDNDSWTALLAAAYDGHIATIDHLVNHYHLDVHAKDKDGWTALHVAACKGNAGMIDHMVNHYHLGVHVKDNDGDTALHVAGANDNVEAIDVLLRYGADVHVKNNIGETPAVSASERGKSEAALKLKAYEKQYPPGPRPSRAAALLSSAIKPPTMPTSAAVAQPLAAICPAPSAAVTTPAPAATPAAKPLPTLPKVLPKAPMGKVIGLYPYQASDDTELSVMEGQRLLLIEKQASGWWLCELNGKRGLVPGNYLQEDITSSASLASSSAQASVAPSAGVVPVIITPSVTPPHAISTPSHPSASASSSSITHSSGEGESLSLTDTKDFDQWVIPYSDLALGKRLGKGSFGEVHLATYVHEPVAVKTLYVGETAKVLEDFKREVTVMMHLKSMYIVQLRAVTIKPYSMVMEYLPKGSLTQLLHNESEPLPWSQRHQLASDIAKGLAFLHHHHVFHRDLKSDNVLLTKDYQAKLSDFGLSKIKAAGSQQSSLTGGSVGTLCWMAPEVMDEDDKSPYRAASDVYSYAMIVWELMTRRQPYEGLSAKQLYVKVVIKAQRELIPEEAPPILQAITAQGWVQTPEERPSADDMVKQLAANPITPSAEPPVPIGLASNTASLYGQRLGSALGISGAGFAPNTASLAPGSSPSASSTAGSSPSGPGFWNNLASLPPASRASVPPAVIRR